MEGTDLGLQKSLVISDAEANGGRRSYTQVSSNVLNNMFRNVTEGERTAGVIRYRKFFFRNKNASNENAVNSRIWISQKSTGGDYFRLKTGTDIDTQAEADDYTDWAGTGHLTQALATDSTSMEVLFDVNNGVYNGSLLRLADSSGGEEFLTVKSSGGVNWVGNLATILTTSGARSTYPASQNSLISTVIELGNLVAAASGVTVTSVGTGDYDDTAFPLPANNKGTVTDSWTLEFTGAATFTVSGTHTGSVGSGSTVSNFQPINTFCGTGDYYFQILSAGWSGTFQVGDTMTFTTTHAASGLWMKEVVPSGCAAKTSNKVSFQLYAEGS